VWLKSFVMNFLSLCIPVVLNGFETCLMVRRDYGLIVFESEC
jgi:hypothetical protein